MYSNFPKKKRKKEKREGVQEVGYIFYSKGNDYVICVYCKLETEQFSTVMSTEREGDNTMNTIVLVSIA